MGAAPQTTAAAGHRRDRLDRQHRLGNLLQRLRRDHAVRHGLHGARGLPDRRAVRDAVVPPRSDATRRHGTGGTRGRATRRRRLQLSTTA
jgi:hypothetical protein